MISKQTAEYSPKCIHCQQTFSAEEKMFGLWRSFVVQGQVFRFHPACEGLCMKEWIIHYLEVNATKVS